MPSRTLKPCTYPGCDQLVKSGRCEAHQQPRVIQRDPERQRLYGRKWQKRRAAHLAKHPWCELCLADGIYTPATDVHHTIPHRGDVKLFWSSPLESLCHSCHSRETVREGGGAQKVLNKGMSSAGVERREKNSQCEKFR
ncbi:MAG: HNH endonuclease [Anaerolineaceae bacterium]|nr:HNH endonuclease [Anaerolineaceae bacterium]